jgi:PKD repeat protein
MKKILFAAIVAGLWFGCTPDRDDDIQLPPTPGDPMLSVEFVPGDSNRLIIRDLSAGSFQRVWDMPGGQPKTSTKAVDTVAYTRAGTYVITLFASQSDGSGTPSASTTVTILNDAALSCSPKLELLTNCEPQGKCWTLTRAAGAVKVGPTYDDYSWFTSPVDGLQDAQYDDGFCFTFDGLVYQNKNNGASVDPWNGYAAVPYDPGVSEFVFLEGTGISGRDQILIPNDQFMGVWDADNLMDVVTLTSTELVVRARQRAQNGTPAAEGWFELHFVPQ